MKIRKGTLADGPILQKFQIAMAWESEKLKLDPPRVRRGVQHVLRHPEIGHYLVCSERTQILGCLLVLKEWSDWRARTVWWIHSVYVAPEARRRGVYAALYGHLQAKARAAKDVAGIRLYVDTTNTRAQEVYARLGMKGDHYRVFEWFKP